MEKKFLKGTVRRVMISSKYKLKKKNNYISLILTFFIIILVSFFILRISISYIQQKIQYMLDSQKFEQYLIIKINDKLSRIANSELSDDEKLFYKDIFKKIYIKFTPIIDDAINEINRNKK
jgi:predicted PurR-regulated permease PerM